MPDATASHATTARPLEHGGDLTRIANAPGAFPGPWLDLSTGINPWAYPVPPLPPGLWQSLPDAAAMAGLLAAAADHYGAPSAETVTAAAGSQALIQWLPRLRAPGRVAVLGPTYSEHAAAWTFAGHEVFQLAETQALDGDWDVVVVTNPNNPDGRRVEPSWLAALADRLAARGGVLVVDEAFADPDPALSLAGLADRPGRIVLRSFGKFFGLAGLRLGFALADLRETARLRAALGPWPVSGPAARIATATFRDRDWIAATRARLPAAARDLDRLLAGSGLTPCGGTALFRLAESDHAGAVAAGLRRRGIHIRDFSDQPRRLRFGLPPDPAASARLAKALAASVAEIRPSPLSRSSQ